MNHEESVKFAKSFEFKFPVEKERICIFCQWSPASNFTARTPTNFANWFKFLLSCDTQETHPKKSIL